MRCNVGNERRRGESGAEMGRRRSLTTEIKLGWGVKEGEEVRNEGKVGEMVGN